MKSQAAFTPVVVNRHRHHYVKTEVNIYVANKNEVRKFSVDTLSYDNWMLGKKVKFK